jgi:hypothetical protein
VIFAEDVNYFSRQFLPAPRREKNPAPAFARAGYFSLPEKRFYGGLRCIRRQVGTDDQCVCLQRLFGFQQRQDGVFRGAPLPRFQVLDNLRRNAAAS